MKIFSIISFLFLSHYTYADWPRPKNELYFKLNQWWVIYDKYFDQNGNLINLSRTRSMGSSSIYAEYGITDKITSIIYFPFFSKATLFQLKAINSGAIVKKGDAISSIGDTNVTLKYGLIVGKPISLTTSVTFGIPFGIESGGYDGSLQTGDGEFNQFVKLSMGQSIKVGNKYPYYIIYTGLNNRTKGFSDEMRFGAETGIKLSGFLFLFRIYSTISLNNGSASEKLFNNVPAANNTEYVIIAPEISVDFSSSSGLTFSYLKALSGQYFFSNPSYAVGMFVNIK